MAQLRGGHHITREDYDIDLLCQSIKYMRDKYDLEIYLEPGEAVALNAGYLVSQVMDVVNNGIDIAILDLRRLPYARRAGNALQTSRPRQRQA